MIILIIIQYYYECNRKLTEIKIMNLINRAKFQPHPFHLVDASPWPIVVSFAMLGLALGSALAFHGYAPNYYITLGLVVVTASILFWLRDVVSEATYLGDHTKAVQKGINLGFLLFILSEALAFAGVFWTYFHSALSPTIEIVSWPPLGIDSIGPLGLPLLNTMLLLSSGAFVTYSHHGLINGDRKAAIIGLILTIVLASIFTACQGIEYYNATFTIADSVYGSVFYAGTGLHGLHVILGTLMLTAALWRIYAYHLTDTHHVGYETSILYWHFVDLVWLFLYVVFYYWGS